VNKWMSTAVLVAAAVLGQGCATDTHVGGSTQVGKVDKIFVEAYPGLFVDRAVATAPSDKPAWVSVTFSTPLADGRLTAVAMLDSDAGIEPGDLVEVRFAKVDSFGTDTEPEYNRITALIARHGSQPALALDKGAFGESEAGRKLERLSAASALP